MGCKKNLQKKQKNKVGQWLPGAGGREGGWESMGIQARSASFWVDKNVTKIDSKIDCGNGCITP